MVHPSDSDPGRTVRLLARTAGVLLVALVVAALTTTGEVYVDPRPAALAAGLLMGAVAITVRPRLAPAMTILAAAAAGAASGHLLAASGIPRVHDLLHLWGIWAYGRCVVEGFAYPTWVPYLGAGIPLLEFYGPLNFLLALPGILAGLSPVGAWKLEFFSGNVLASLSTLGAARVLGAGWRASLIAAFAIAFAPWRLAVFHYRGALAEANGFIFTPLVAAATLRMAQTPGPGVATVLIVAATALVLTHLLSLFALLAVLVPALLVNEWLSGTAANRPRRLALLAGCWLAVAGVTAAWWMPVAAEVRHTAVRVLSRDDPYVQYDKHGVSFRGMLERRKWDRVRVSLPETVRRKEGLEGEQMPFYVGSVLVVLGLTAGWWSGRRAAWAPAAGALPALLLSSGPLAGLAAAAPWFSWLQFPWRFLSPATVLAALALALGADSLFRAGAGWKRLVLPAVVLTALVWDGAPYTGAADRIPAYTGVTHWFTRDATWVHWDASLTPVRVDWSRERGVTRVRNLELPPSEYATEIDSFFPGYYLWLTPVIYREYWRSSRVAAMVEAGVKYGFNIGSRDPAVWPARAYATLEVPGRPEMRVASGRVRRQPGRIEIDVDVPAGGGLLVVREQAFPGWRWRPTGGRWSRPGARRGFLTVDLAAGRQRIELAYGSGTPARRAGMVGSLVSLVLLGAIAMRLRRARE